jgi:hypothetical protein
MSIVEALAVYAYLENTPHEQRSKAEREVFQAAWVTIIAHAKAVIHEDQSR